MLLPVVVSLYFFITLHVRGEVIVIGVHIYIYCIFMFVDQNNLNRTFSDRLTFSNIRGRTSRQIYRLVCIMYFHNFDVAAAQNRISLIQCQQTDID